MPDPDHLPRLTSVVPFLYGVADRSWLPGSVLTRLLVEIGATEDGAHDALVRLRKNGALGTERRGRETDYQLAGLVRLAAWRARAASDPERFAVVEPPVWEGSFSGLLYDVPKSEPKARKRLVRATRQAGYGRLRPGLMIAIRSGWMALADVVADLPPTAYVHPVTLGMKTDDARRAASEAWRLDSAAAEITATAERLEQVAATNQVGAAALRDYVRWTLPAYQLLVEVPTLPRQLSPDDWPLDRMINALGRVRDDLGAAAQAHVGELLSRDRESADLTPVGE